MSKSENDLKLEIIRNKVSNCHQVKMLIDVKLNIVCSMCKQPCTGVDYLTE